MASTSGESDISYTMRICSHDTHTHTHTHTHHHISFGKRRRKRALAEAKFTLARLYPLTSDKCTPKKPG